MKKKEDLMDEVGLSKTERPYERRMYERILEQQSQQDWEPERKMFEQILLQTEAVATQGDDRPHDLKGHYQLNDKVSFDIDAKIDPDWVKNHNHNTPYGSAWDYQNAQITLFDKKNKELAKLRTLGGFVETLEPENQYGSIATVKRVNPNTQFDLFTSNYKEGEKGMISETVNAKNPNGKDRRMTFFFDYAGNEDYKKVLHDLYYTLNPQEKETATEKLNNLKNRVQEKLDNMAALIKGQTAEKTEQAPTIDDGRTV